jgi:hypothetical protein
MEVPRSVWPQGVWPPLSYQVVEVADEKTPAIEVHPLPGRPSPEREASQPPLLPWAQRGYRVVEVVEETSPGPTRRRSPGADAAKGAPPTRKLRPLVRWGVVAGGAFLLTAAIAVAARLPARAQGAGDHSLSGENSLLSGLQCAARDSQCAARENFGTAIGFVRNPPEAARVAAQEHKLLFLLHVSGSFDDAGFT